MAQATITQKRQAPPRTDSATIRKALQGKGYFRTGRAAPMTEQEDAFNTWKLRCLHLGENQAGPNPSDPLH